MGQSRHRTSDGTVLTIKRISIRYVRRSVCFWLFGLFLINPALAQAFTRQVGNRDLPRVFLLDAKQLQEAKNRIRAGDESVSAAWLKLDAEAQKALTSGPFSCGPKIDSAASGTKHDYMSQAPYFWPDPNNLMACLHSS